MADNWFDYCCACERSKKTKPDNKIDQSTGMIELVPESFVEKKPRDNGPFGVVLEFLSETMGIHLSDDEEDESIKYYHHTTTFGSTEEEWTDMDLDEDLE
jgi:hypothetical protein